MPTGFYPTAAANNATNGEGAHTASPPNDDDVVSVTNNSTRRTKKRCKRISNDNNDDDEDDDDCCSTSSSVVVTITKSHEDSAGDVDNSSEEEEQLIIGTSIVPPLLCDKDDDKLTTDNDERSGRCWSCFIHLNKSNDGSNKSDNDGQPTTASKFFTTHEHPLLSIPVCSICNDRAEAVEGKVIDAHLTRVNDGTNADSMGISGGNANNNDGHVEEAEEVNACSWCGLTTLNETSSHSTTTSSSPSSNNQSSTRMTIIGGVPNQTSSTTTYLEDIPLGDNGTNELLLCDNCPRGMCVKCCTVSLGGHVDALKAVRRDCNDGEEWKCCYCQPTQFLGRLREEYRLVCCGEDGELEKKKKKNGEDDDDGMMNVDGGNDDTSKEEDEDDDAKIARLIDELTAAENELATAQQMLSKKEIEQTRHEIESELLLNDSSSLGLEDLTEAVENELGDYLQKWQRAFDLCSDAIVRLQEELEEGGVQLAQFYKFREEEEQLSNDDGEGSDYAREAEMGLDERDVMEGFHKGEFRGSNGYKCPNAKIYKLEPEDLDNSNLNEIEDINTLEGAVSQMESNSMQVLTSWRGRTGTTSEDIEMLQKKSVKCEERDLGGLIDLKKLEKNCIREDDDIVEDHKVEMIIRSKKKGGKTGSRVVKQNTSLLVRKKQAAKSKRRGRLSGDVKEYQPRAPPQPRPQQDGAPKAKKRAQLLPLVSSGTLSGRTSPVMKGVLMGSEVAKFEDSDVILEVAGCERKQVSVCRPLATLLKDHQKEGLQFCWKNVCHDILNPNEALYEGVRGAILAHNMGLGKSFQAVCLLHTLMTHPSLVLPSPKGVGLTNGANGRKSSSNRIVLRAMLIAPVNTLANWEQEFEKWIGPNVPAVRFFSWTEAQSKSKIIKEWYEEGGILCCSSDRYASSCKGFLETDDKDKEKDVPSKDDAFFRKALFNPGPDIVCLDEVHTMLKTTTSQIYKVLNGIGTKLRFALTGSPIQNNLFEYYRMASWVRPGSLGTEAYFEKTFANPIMDGMAADCSIFQAEWQVRRTKELREILSDFVHRRDNAVLKKELPFHQTAIIHVRQSKVQVKLYQDFRKYQKRSGDLGFFKQYHALRPVSNHPACLIGDAEKESSSPDSPSTNEEKEKPKAEGEDLGDQPQVAPDKHAWICDICNVAKFRTFDEAVKHEETCTGVEDTAASTQVKGSVAKEADNTDWWRPFADKAVKNDLDINAIENGGKIVLLLQIIAHCDLIGDKVVVFSQCLNTLTFIEGIIQSDDWGGFKPHLPNNICQQKLGGWKRNHDYVRIDGSVDAKERGDLITSFNSSNNQHTRLFLLSTKAGGLGVNLVAANRVVLFDSHWNPVVDLQAVYRCYRYGQTKPTFCYRLLGEGSMEEKIYSRAATKASLSELVIDQKNPARSFTKKEMDLLQHENTWLCCEWCDKWRMLPPGLTAEQVEQQTSMDTWCCEDNIYDEDRQCCEATERDQKWMLNYWERRARQDAGINSQSQSQNDAPSNEVLPPNAITDEKHAEKTERDVVLQALLSRTEEKRSASTKGANNSSSKSSMSWISQYSFQKEKSADDETKLKAATPEATAEAPAKTKVTSPKKKASPKKRASSSKKSTKSSPPKNGKSPSKKSSKSPAKKKGKSALKRNHTSPSKENGTSPSRIDKYLSPKKNGSSTKAKAARLAAKRAFKSPEGTAEIETESKQPNSKKRKDDVIDLCDSD